MSDPQRPLCFVLMPFGRKSDAAGHDVDFDHVYAQAIAPAVHQAGMEPLRADEERDGGFIHKPMFERLLLCPYAVADLTMANANVFYELGIRHAVRPHSTLMLFSRSAQRLPFDVAPLRALPYEVAPSGQVLNVEALKAIIIERLDHSRDPTTDSPLITLLEGYQAPDLSRLKTDVFRDRVRYSEEAKKRLRRARTLDAPAVLSVEETLGPLVDLEAGVVVDLLLSYRDVSSWDDMLRVVDAMPRELAGTVLVQEQLGFALNRSGRRREALDVLRAVIDRAGPSSETLGLLGRVYKDLWREALHQGDAARAEGLLARAIQTYREGFEHDWRDAYPGINLATLLRVRNPHDPELGQVLSVVSFANQRRLSNTPDYWDHATTIELAYLRGDREAATAAVAAALSAEDLEGWKADSTAANLRLHLDFASTTDEDRRLIEDLVRSLVPAL